MDSFPLSIVGVVAFLLLAIFEPTTAVAQNINELDRQRAARQAEAEWHRLPPGETSCIDQRLRHKGSSLEALIRRGVKPSAGWLIELRSRCREFVESVQMDIAPPLTRDAPGSPTHATSGPTEPTDADVTSAQSATDSGMTSAAEPSKEFGGTSIPEPSKDFSVTHPPEESGGRGAEEQLQKGNAQENSGPGRGIMGSLSAAFLSALVAVAVLLGMVASLFIRWRNTGHTTATVSLPEKKSEEAHDTPLKTTVADAGKVVTREGPATLMSQDSANISEIGPTYGEIFPGIASNEVSETKSAGNCAVENVAQLAELCARGAPSDKDFQRIKDVNSELGRVQERKK